MKQTSGETKSKGTGQLRTILETLQGQLRKVRGSKTERAQALIDARSDIGDQGLDLDALQALGSSEWGNAISEAAITDRIADVESAMVEAVAAERHQRMIALLKQEKAAMIDLIDMVDPFWQAMLRVIEIKTSLGRYHSCGQAVLPSMLISLFAPRWSWHLGQPGRRYTWANLLSFQKSNYTSDQQPLTKEQKRLAEKTEHMPSRYK